MRSNKILFSVDVARIQEFAVEYAGRKLTDEELLKVQEGLVEGLSFDIETVFATAIDEAIHG